MRDQIDDTSRAADRRQRAAQALPAITAPPNKNQQGPYDAMRVVRRETSQWLSVPGIFEIPVSLPGEIEAMPINARFRLPIGTIEVAPRFGLRAAIPRALRRHGPMTSVELANWAYWDRTPRNHRMGARWWANASQRSATRRAIARLKRDGAIKIAVRRGRRFVYAIAREVAR